jgi:triacylglycerol esterase/lipase EstA (alpha/beta hydrolase family)
MPSASRLALLLRLVGCLQGAAACAWALWCWPRAPAAAVAGTLLILLAAPLVLAIEFALLAAVTRAHPRPARASVAQLARAWLGETCQQFRVFYWRQPLRWRALPDHLPATARGRRGVVFVHGLVCNRGFWRPWMLRLRALGHPHVAVNLEPVFGSIDGYAPIVEDAVRRVTACTGQAPVLVCHSMGGLVARSWLRSAGGAARVAHVVTIASPHHGTWLARFSHTTNGRQMRLHSAWLQQLASDEAGLVQPPWTCWYSNCDNIVFPAATATLAGAENRFLAGEAHVSLAFRPEVVDATLAALGAPDHCVSR